jgi:predicted transcriptional regulator
MLPSQADTFKRNKQKAQMLTETHEALAEIEASELISGDKVLDWLDSWGDENEKPSPV